MTNLVCAPKVSSHNGLNKVSEFTHFLNMLTSYMWSCVEDKQTEKYTNKFLSTDAQLNVFIIHRFSCVSELCSHKQALFTQRSICNRGHSGELSCSTQRGLKCDQRSSVCPGASTMALSEENEATSPWINTLCLVNNTNDTTKTPNFMGLFYMKGLNKTNMTKDINSTSRSASLMFSFWIQQQWFYA